MQSYLSLIKFSHTIFALPFAIIGFCLQIGIHDNEFSLLTFVLMVLCMVFARSAAMAFNRYIDRDIDLKNERTKSREIPAGVISSKSALFFIVLCSLLFVTTTYFINLQCFLLSPLALFVILFYSYTKRFTFLCHFVLGMGLGLAPIGAYLAAGGAFDWIPIIYSFVVMFWVAGFDIIYSLQDEDFDKSLNLNSVPVKFGRLKALKIARLCHIICAFLLVLVTFMLSQIETIFAYLHILGALVFIGLLVFQHKLVKADDLSKVNLAFFTTNGVASIVYAFFVVYEILIA